MHRVWIGIGSNLSDPKKQADRAVWALSKLPKSKLVVCSSYYRSYPLGQQNQPDFLNAILVLDTELVPEKLLEYIQSIEEQQGRMRNSLLKRCWQPRTLDLDILLYDKYYISTDSLIVPHYDMLNREFVIYPLFELDCNLVFPNDVPIKNIINTVPKNGLRFWKE